MQCDIDINGVKIDFIMQPVLRILDLVNQQFLRKILNLKQAYQIKIIKMLIK